MALFNYTAREITLKVVYYGPGFSGKTTNLQHLHSILPSHTRGKLISLATEADRTLFFDFLPIDLGKVKDFNIRFQLYTVPGQVRYNATRRLVLKGADAVVFVADSQKEMKEQNIESFNNMKDNLNVNGIDPEDIPIVFQYNKRDIKNIMSVEELNADLNRNGAPLFEAVAVEGKGVEETFKEVTNALIKYIVKRHKIDIEPPAAAEPPAPDISIPSPPPPKKHELPVTPSPEPQTLMQEPPPPARPNVIERTTIQQVPAAPDLSELVLAIGELKDVMSDISNSLKDIQKKQTKLVNELFEIRQIFSDAKRKKGLSGFFR